MITVALSGDGGDEQFYGYTRYNHVSKIARLYRIPNILRQILSSFISPNMFGMDLSHKIKSLGFDTVFTANDNLTNILPSLKNAYYGVPLYRSKPEAAEIQLALENYLMLKDLNDYMIEDVLTKVDRTSMRYGLEVRVPLLDHKVVENSFYNIPLCLKTDFSKKHVLKTILSDYLPKELFERPKRGFGIPLQKFINNTLSTDIKNALSEKSCLDEFFNKKELMRAFSNANIINTKFGSEFFWRVYTFLSWEKRYKPVG